MHHSLKAGRRKARTLYSLCALIVATTLGAGVHTGKIDFTSFQWKVVNEDAPWEARAGLQVVNLKDRFSLMGGRTPIDPAVVPVPGASTIWGDVWRSLDQGKTWRRILDADRPGHWPARAYFKAVTKGRYMYVLGGQNFNIVDNPACPPFPTDCPPQIPQSDFFNDVWRSSNGVRWQQLTDDAGWEGRAGLSSVVLNGEIYVMGGSKNDDESIVGETGPARIYFDDVWKSADGSNWERVAEHAPWEPRAGGVAVEKDGYIYLLGGEDGFLCDPLPFCELPYFNDVWRTNDGANWELVTPQAGWSARPGHQCVVYKDHFVCFGGFGAFANPMDVWVSPDGADWEQVSDSPWNAVAPTQIKYDFDALTLPAGRYNSRPKNGSRSHWWWFWLRSYSPETIYTFGGDRETFDFSDPTNYLNVDNDVWAFAPPSRRHLWFDAQEAGGERELATAESFVVPSETKVSVYPNPTSGAATITYAVVEPGDATVSLYDVSGRLVRELSNRSVEPGSYTIQWDGRDNDGSSVANGVYMTVLRTKAAVRTTSIVVVK